MDTRDVGIEAEREIVLRAAADGKPVAGFEREDALGPVAVAVDEKRLTPALGLEPLLELGG